MSVKVDCSNCDQQNWVDFETLRHLQRVKCEGCGISYNLFGVYEALYESNPLCREIADVSVKSAHTNYVVEARNATERGVILDSLESNSFQSKSKKMMRDLTILGNSFLQITPKKEIQFKRLEPSQLDFTIDWVQEPPFRALQQKIVEIRKHDEPSEKYEVSDVLHFKSGSVGYDPFGQSIFGFWFASWYFLREMSKNAPLRELRKHQNLQWFQDFRKSTVLAATAVPHHLLFPWMKIDPKVIKIEQDRFQHYIERRRNEVSWLIERELFPRIVKRKFKYENFPRLKWKSS